MSNDDAAMLSTLKDTLDGLAFKYSNSDFDTQQQLGPKIQELNAQYNALRSKLVSEANVITADDLTQMTAIRDAIDQAADTQALILGIARAVFFIGTKL
jgi:CRISPR/Cas system CMR-associated protein Cmr5 small subunit